MLYLIGRFISALLIKSFGRLKVIGRENVPRTGGVVLAPNHTSYIDPPLVGVAAPRPVWFMAKSELFNLPVVGRLLHRVHAFPVKRDAVDRRALGLAHKLLTGGAAVTIFIEGGRSPDGRLMEPSLGPAMIALRAGVPIVPVAVINADHLLPRHGIFFRFSRVTAIFGPPLTFPHLQGKQADRAALQEVSTTVMRHIAELLRAHGAGDRVPAGYLQHEETQDDG